MPTFYSYMLLKNVYLMSLSPVAHWKTWKRAYSNLANFPTPTLSQIKAQSETDQESPILAPWTCGMTAFVAFWKNQKTSKGLKGVVPNQSSKCLTGILFLWIVAWDPSLWIDTMEPSSCFNQWSWFSSLHLARESY